MSVISKEAVGNSWDTLNTILGHRYQNHPNRVIKQIKPKFATSVFDNVCVLQYAYAPLTFDLDLVSE